VAINDDPHEIRQTKGKPPNLPPFGADYRVEIARLGQSHV
jgi:hypothetical protein